MGTDADKGEILLLVETLGLIDCLLEDVVDGADREGMIEQVSEQFTDATERAVADEDQAQDQLAQPRSGDGQPEEQILWGSGRGEGQVETLVGLVQLLIDELAADVVVMSELGDGDAFESGESQLLAHLSGQRRRSAGRGRVER